MGKTESFIRHLAYHKLGEHKGSRRVWLEGRRLADVGFKAGVRYQVGAADGTLRLRLSKAGSHVVSHKQGRPVVDLLTRQLGDVERVEVRFTAREVLISVHPLDRAAAARLVRLNARIQGGQPVRLGSLSHGGGIATDALLRGLGAAGVSAELAFGLDIEGRYIEHSLEHNPAWRAGGMSVEADLGEVDAELLPQVDVLQAGLPCVSASRAGRAKKGLERPEQDAVTADLVVAFLDVIRATQPAVILLENVPEYADSASADIIRRRLGRWGYEIHEHAVDGAAWSLEARKRWVLVAVTRGLAINLDELASSGERPAALGEVLDARTPASSWRRFAHLDAKETRDAARGSKFSQRLLTSSSTSVPTLRRGYQKAGSTDPRLAHPSRAGYSRLLSPAEHARIKGVPPELVKGASDTMAHEILGQSVISPAFAALGRLVGAALA